MASVFQTYFQLGFLHICTPRAADYLTFLLALCALTGASLAQRNS